MKNKTMTRLLFLAGTALVISLLFAAPASAGDNDSLLVLYIIGVDLEGDDPEWGGAGSTNMYDLTSTWNTANGQFLAFYGEANKPGWNDGTAIADCNNLIDDLNEDGQIGSDFGRPTSHILGKLNGNTANPETLKDAIRYTNEYAKANGLENAKRYIILWDHGGATWGIGYDSTLHISNDEIAQALALSDKKFEMIIYDACLMANLEAAYAVRNTANYMLASEEAEPGEGLDYGTVSEALASGKYSTVDGAKLITRAYFSDDINDKTHSLMDLSRIDGVITALNRFGTELNTVMDNPESVDTISWILPNTELFYGDGTMDLYDFADRVAQLSEGSIHDAAENLKNAVSSAIVYSEHKQAHPKAYGVSISSTYMFETTDNIDYSVWIDNGAWADFMRNLVTARNEGYEPQYSYSSAVRDADTEKTLTITDDSGLSIVMVDYLYLDGNKYYILGQEPAENELKAAPENPVWISVPTGKYTTGEDWSGSWFVFDDGKEQSTATFLWEREFEDGGVAYSVYSVAGTMTRTENGRELTAKSKVYVTVNPDKGTVTDMYVQSETDDNIFNRRANLWGNGEIKAGDRFTPVLDYLTDSSDDIYSETGKTHIFSANPAADLKFVTFDADKIFWDYEIDTFVTGSESIHLNENQFAQNNGTITAKPTGQSNQGPQKTQAASPLCTAGIFAGLLSAALLLKRR